MLKLSDFAVMNGVTPRGARKLLQTYEKDLEGHFERKGQNGTWIDATAQEFLRSKMIKNPVILYDEEAFPLISENRELKKENDKLQERLSEAFEKLSEARDQQLQLQAQLAEQKLLSVGKEEAERKASEAEAALRLTDEAREQAEKQAVELRQKNVELEVSLEAEKEEAAAIKAELDRLKSRGFWARLFNRES